MHTCIFMFVCVYVCLFQCVFECIHVYVCWSEVNLRYCSLGIAHPVSKTKSLIALEVTK